MVIPICSHLRLRDHVEEGEWLALTSHAEKLRNYGCSKAHTTSNGMPNTKERIYQHIPYIYDTIILHPE